MNMRVDAWAVAAEMHSVKAGLRTGWTIELSSEIHEKRRRYLSCAIADSALLPCSVSVARNSFGKSLN
jgi:hypothetical protein